MLNISEDSLFFFVIMSSTLLLVLLGFFFAFIQLYRRKQLLFHTAQKQREQEYSEELMRTQLEIREQVMRQISEELHDNIGQSIIVAKMQLATLDKAYNPEQVKTADELLGRSLNDLRSISKVLNGQYILRAGFYEALKNEVRFINTAQKIDCTLTGDSPEYRLSANSEILLFRCIQEILGNAIKHAEASQVEIGISENNEALSIEISDNGKGLPIHWKAQKGLGIENLKKRIRLLNGTIDFQSKEGVGTKISINLPKIHEHHVSRD